MLATLIRQVGDFQLAEDAVQDALAAAVATWPRDGVPDQPRAWITVTARHRATDRLRRACDRGPHRPAGRAGSARRPGASARRRPAHRGDGGRPASAHLHVLPPCAGHARRVALTPDAGQG